MANETPQWVLVGGASGSAVDPNNLPEWIKDTENFTKKLDTISEVLGVVLQVLGIAKQFAALLEDPLTAVVSKLDEKIQAYLRDTGGLYLTTNWPEVKKNWDTEFDYYAPQDTVNTPVKNIARVRKTFSALAPFKGISSFNNNIAQKILDTSIHPRPESYNSGVIGAFLVAGVGAEGLPSLLKLVAFLQALFTRAAQAPTATLTHGFTLNPAPGDAIALDANTVYSYNEVIRRSRTLKELSITVDTDLLSCMMNDMSLVIYTNPQGFTLIEDADGKAVTDPPKPTKSRQVYHLEEDDLKKLVFDAKGLPIDLGSTGKAMLDEGKREIFEAPLTFQHTIDLSNRLATINEELLLADDKDRGLNIFNLKMPVVKATGIELVDNPTDTIYARAYFVNSISGEKFYSNPLTIRKPIPIDFDGLITNLVLCLLYYKTPEESKTPKAQDFRRRYTKRIPKDLITLVDNYVYDFRTNYGYTYDELLDSWKFKALVNAVSDYPRLFQHFNLNYSQELTSRSDKLKATRESLKLQYLNNLDIHPGDAGKVGEFYTDATSFLDEFLILKGAPNDIRDDVWKELAAWNVKPLKELSDRMMRYLKEFAESLKGSGQGIVKFITNLERIVQGLKEVIDAINTFIKLILELIKALSGSFSINLLTFPDQGGTAASSTQDLANKLTKSVIPPTDDVPNPDNQYYIGAALVCTTGVPNIVLSTLLGLVYPPPGTATTLGDDEDIEL